VDDDGVRRNIIDNTKIDYSSMKASSGEYSLVYEYDLT
jgi:hypothetical protein